MKILNLLLKKTGKLANLTDDAVKIASKKATFTKSIFAQADDACVETGKYLRMQKPRKVTIQSHPTQQYLDDMLGVAKTERASQVTKDGCGWVNRKAAADAHYAFTKGTHIEPVVITSTPTAEVINNMHRVDYVDAMRRADVLGEVPADVLARRREIVDVFDNHIASGSERLALAKHEIETLNLDENKLEDCRTIVDIFHKFGF